MRLLGYIVAVFVGLPAAFVVAAAVFADGPPLLGVERLAPVVITYLITAAIAGFIFGMIWPSRAAWWLLGVCFSLPALAAVGALGRDIGLQLQLVYYLVALASACFGAIIGMVPARILGQRGK